MKVLISAYACEPGRGSEPEVGWQWALGMAKYHDVTVVTRANNREVIETYFRQKPEESGVFNIVYYDLPECCMRWKKRLKAHELYYVCWQKSVRKLIDRLVAESSFDLVHLVTFASFRYPVFLSNLKVPVVWGPVGGAEQAPWSLLWYRLRFPACLKEVARNLATSLSSLAVRWLDPTRTSGGQVIASTPRTQEILKQKGIDASLVPTIGVHVEEENALNSEHQPGQELKLIFVGRLVLLKGVHLLLDAYAQAELPHARLTIVGDGSEMPYLKTLAKKLGIHKEVSFLGQVPKTQLSELYASHHVVVAPSLYESGGYMVLEGFQQRKPAIVLDVGGPAMSVDETCGIKVPLGSGREVVSGLSKALRYYADNPETITRHGNAGFKKLCKMYAWDKKSAMMERVYQQAVSSMPTS